MKATPGKAWGTAFAVFCSLLVVTPREPAAAADPLAGYLRDEINYFVNELDYVWVNQWSLRPRG